MASEEDLAAYIAAVLPRLVAVGATGAVLWCFADYDARLWDQPPCDEAWHERHFGLIRPDGTLKPHADVLRRFAAKRPAVQPATRQVTLDISADEYYRDPLGHARRLYAQYLEEIPRATAHQKG
jgi:endo-1,4-beta-mannosidase